MAQDNLLGALGKTSELKNRILFVLGAIIVYRLGAHIPVPGIDPLELKKLFDSQSGGILGMFNMFSGGALSRFTLFALGIMPYISASIIMQLLTVVSPQLEQLKKEGEAGRRAITKYTRYGTVILAAFQALGISIALESQPGLVIDPGLAFRLTSVVTLVSGTMFLMWLGEQITERGIGNGISIIIFTGIVAGLPSALGSTLELARTGAFSIPLVFFLFAATILVTALVVFVERGQRKITVNYAKRQVGNKLYGGQTSHLPLKLNMAGVIPPIFASSLLLLPITITQLGGNKVAGESAMGDFVISLNQYLAHGQPVYLALYGLGIIFFCFFYTAVVFNPEETSENLKKAGGFIPGIRPGKNTESYLDYVLTRITVLGAAYLTLVCLLPDYVMGQTGQQQFFAIGGTSLLILVNVTIDTISQIQSHLLAHQYGDLLKKAKLKGGRAR